MRDRFHLSQRSKSRHSICQKSLCHYGWPKRNQKLLCPQIFANRTTLLCRHFARCFWCPSGSKPIERYWGKLGSFPANFGYKRNCESPPFEVFKVSPQFWSIGTEFQLYAVLPAILLPIARQKSMAWSVLFSLLLCVPIISISSVATIDRACLHYIFTFSLGAFVADRLFSKQPLNLKVYVLPVCILFFLAIATAKVSLSLWAVRDLTLSPFIATALYLLVSNNFQSKAKSLVMTVLRSNLVLALGKRSYSLYLCHFLAIGLVHTILISMGASVSQKLVALVIVAPCLGLGISFAMFALVEAPSLKWIKNFRTTPSESNENERQTALAA